MYPAPNIITNVESRLSHIHCVGEHVLLHRPLLIPSSPRGIRLAIIQGQNSRDPSKTQNGKRNIVHSARLGITPPPNGAELTQKFNPSGQ
jgi:hypothetical protein